MPSDSPSHAHATAAAITGSLIATTLVAVGLRCRNDASSNAYGTSVPSTMTHAIGIHNGTLTESSDPSIDASWPSTEKSNIHHGWAIPQKIAESANIQNVRVIG